jgi:uncharacterized membrane protein
MEQTLSPAPSRRLAANVVQAHRRGDARQPGPIERGLSAAAGTALLVRGATRRDLAGWLAVAAGSALIVRGAAARSQRVRQGAEVPAAVEIARSITVGEGAPGIAALLREPERWLAGGVVESVAVDGERWSVCGRVGPSRFAWEADVHIAPDGSASWRAAPGSAFFHTGTLEIRQAPDGRGSVVRIDGRCEPAGAFGRALAAKLRGALERALGHALHRFREVLEAGELARTEPQPHARPRLPQRARRDRGES